jgi:8-oxo-dGTP pyrophosphatase MutT (NUDIX family)
MRAIRYQAAGGVVVDSGRVLVLRRPSREEVRLPKGHIKKKESRAEAALREVTEESGYADLEILADLGHQVVEYDYQGAHVVRDEYYYLMHLRSSRQTEREEQEHQFIPDWLDWDEALSTLTYQPEREWVQRAYQREMKPRQVHYNAAGGVVVDRDRVLILRRSTRGDVRLPKGTVNKDESIPEAALREVSEESGYADLEIVTDLGKQVEEFDTKGSHVTRNEHYYLMHLRSLEQVERDRVDLQFAPDWVTWDEALSELTYETEREWVQRARKYRERK